jgi:hypothetical protein
MALSRVLGQAKSVQFGRNFRIGKIVKNRSEIKRETAVLESSRRRHNTTGIRPLILFRSPLVHGETSGTSAVFHQLFQYVAKST